jgi:hypothetical protein
MSPPQEEHSLSNLMHQHVFCRILSRITNPGQSNHGLRTDQPYMRMQNGQNRLQPVGGNGMVLMDIQIAKVVAYQYGRCAVHGTEVELFV